MRVNRPMIAEYAIQPCSQRCSRTGRELKPGEKYYAMLFCKEGTLTREDVCMEAWIGPPPEAHSFWVGRVPLSGPARTTQVDPNVVMDLFAQSEKSEDPKQIRFRYVLALLLVRHRRLKLEGIEYDETGTETLVLLCPKTRKLLRVPNPGMDEGELQAVEIEVGQLLKR